MVRSSKDILVFRQDLISVYRDMLVIKATKEAASYLDLTDHETEQLRGVADRFRKEALLYHCRLLEDSFFAMQKANAVKRVIAELTLVRMCDEALDTSTEALVSRIARLEEDFAMGRTSAKPMTEVSTEAVANEVSAPKAEPASHQEPKATKHVSVAQASQRLEMEDGLTKRILRPLRNWMAWWIFTCRI